jgi:hypothetical protein
MLEKIYKKILKDRFGLDKKLKTSQKLNGESILGGCIYSVIYNLGNVLGR